MKIAKLIILVLLIGLISSCGSMRQMMQRLSELSEDEAFKYDKKYMAEHEALMQTQQDPMVEKWIQPANKKEECKIRVYTQHEDDITLHPEYRAYWDGQCRNGYAYGLGREFEKGFLLDNEAILLYSGKKETPKTYYYKDKLKNLKTEGVTIDDNAYGVVTLINDDPLNFNINIHYGKLGNNPPYLTIITSPLQDNISYRKDYGNFAYLINDFRNDYKDRRYFQFDIQDAKNGLQNGFGFATFKNRPRMSVERIDGIIKRYIELPQSYYEHARKIHNEIIQEGQKALEAQATALQVKRQYKERICKSNVKVNFIDNLEYKAICEEDKYMAGIKTRLDAELQKIAEAKAQDRMVRAREVEAMAAQQQAAAVQQQANAAQQQAEAAAWAGVRQSMSSMGINNQLQQLNNNLFMMRHGF